MPAVHLVGIVTWLSAVLGQSAAFLISSWLTHLVDCREKHRLRASEILQKFRIKKEGCRQVGLPAA